MSSAEHPDTSTDTSPALGLNAAAPSRGLRAAPGSWLRADPPGAGRLPLAGQPGHGQTASLRRQSAWIAHGREGRRTGLFEIICRECGDHPYLDYEDVPPRLQQIRGPYTLEAGLEAYAEHVGLPPAAPGRSGAVPAPRHPDDAGDSRLPADAGSAVTLPPPGQPGHGQTARLRRQPVRLVNGRVEGGYTDAFELICPGCGDDPDLDHTEVPPWLQRLRGPHPLDQGLAAYLGHIGG